MIILFKYYADMKNCESFKSFGYIYIDNNNNNNLVLNFSICFTLK